MAKIALVSHCLLNHQAKVESFENENHQIIEALLDKELGLLQLPCPEFTYLGGDRPGMVKEEYDTPEHRSHCRKILAPLMADLLEYRRLGHDLTILMGIKGSPSCALNQTCGRNSKGLEFETEGAGVFMEELLILLQEHRLDIPTLEVDEKDIDATLSTLKAMIS